MISFKRFALTYLIYTPHVLAVSVVILDWASTADENSVASDYATRPDCSDPPTRKSPCLRLYCLRHNNNYSVTIARLSTDNHYSVLVHDHNHYSELVHDHNHCCVVVHEHSHYCEVVQEHNHYSEVVIEHTGGQQQLVEYGA